MLTDKLDLFAVFLVILIGGFGGGDGALHPCPQFLPVAVRLDSSRIPYKLRGSIKVKDDGENIISKDFGGAHVVSPSDLSFYGNDHSIHKNERLKSSEKLSKNFVNKDASPQRGKKRRRVRPKEPKTLILNQNTNWSLKTINDKPAEEVLMTDKASVARDLKDVTESAIVAVKKLENSKF